MRGLCLFILILFSSVGLGVTIEKPMRLTKKYQELLLADDMSEVSANETRVKLQGLSKTEIAEFVEASKSWVTVTSDVRHRVVMSFDVVRRNKACDKRLAESMLGVIAMKPEKKIEASAMDATVEQRLVIFLAAKMGRLNAARLNREFAAIADRSKSSLERVARAGALIDALTGEGVKPTSAQLEMFLSNDVSEIRMLAVDWFRIAPPADMKDRAKFLVAALATNPRQVSERARRACEVDTSELVRAKCATVKAQGEKP